MRELAAVQQGDDKRILDLTAAYALSKVNTETVTCEKAARMRRSLVLTFLDGRQPEHIAFADVQAYRSSMEAAGYANSTTYRHISIIGGFFEFLMDRGLIQVNPVPKGRWRNGFRPQPYASEKTRGLTREEVLAFLGAIDETTVAGARLTAQVRLMLECGLRAAEVVNVTWENASLDGAHPSIRTKLKGGRWQTFLITDEARDAISHYLTLAGRKPKKGQALFTSIPRQKGGKRDRPMTTYYLYMQIRRIGERLGIRVSPHSFRHTFAQAYHETGATVPEVQGALGHQHSATTRIYLSALAPNSTRPAKAVQGWLNGVDEG